MQSARDPPSSLMMPFVDQEGKITDTLTAPSKKAHLMEADMSNGMTMESSGNGIAVAENHDAKIMSPEIRDALSTFKDEMHGILQLPPEDLAKVDHIEWKLDWKPVLTACLYPKKS